MHGQVSNFDKRYSVYIYIFFFWQTIDKDKAIASTNKAFYLNFIFLCVLNEEQRKED